MAFRVVIDDVRHSLYNYHILFITRIILYIICDLFCALLHGLITERMAKSNSKDTRKHVRVEKRIDENNIILCELHFKPELISQCKYLFIFFVFVQIYGN
jgi:hypothetical protein